MYSKFYLVVSLTLVLAFGFQLSAEETSLGKPLVIKNVSTSYVKTPNISSDTGESSKKGNKDWKWLRIEVEYETYDIDELSDKSGFDKAEKGLKDFQIKFSVATPVGSKYGVFSGNILYDFVALDGKKHYATAFIAPHTYQRNIYKSEYKYDRSELESKKVFVEIVSNKGMRMSWGVHNGKKDFDRLKSSEATMLAKQLNNFMSQLPRNLDFQNTIIGRNKTPWKFLNFDDYEMIKE